MTEHRATISWKRTSDDFSYASYNRDHVWHIEGGVDILASSAPEFRGTRARVDPERALVASISSCHMLTFLTLAARAHFIVDGYEDEAVGRMTKNAKGKLFVSHCILRPRIAWGGDAPPTEVVEKVHERAHEECFIASSVLTEITVEPR